MKLSQKDVEEKTEAALRACLESAPFLEITVIKQGALIEGFQPDLIARVSLAGEEKLLVVEVKNNGQPRFAREAINQLARYRHTKALAHSYGIVVAPYISPQAAEMCEKENFGYLDLAGNCRLTFGTVFIERKGNPNPFAERRDLRSLYSPRASRILRVLLVNPRRTWKVEKLSVEASVSLGHVSNIKKLLLDREWISDGRDGFSLIEPEQLLKEWSENYSFRKNQVRDYYSMSSVSDIEAELVEACGRFGLRYALTGFSGAARLAPFVRYSAAMAYVDRYEPEFPEALAIKEVATGPSVRILTPYDEGVFYDAQEIDGIQIASPIQVYLDLKGIRGRGEEAANTLLREVIRPGW